MAGRPRPTPHRARPSHDKQHPVHLTLRARADLASLRAPETLRVLLAAFAGASKSGFRLVQFTVQADHLQLLVEATSTRALALGARGLTIRTARAVNRALGRKGPVWGDRYQARALTTPRAVREALALFGTSPKPPRRRG